MIRTLIHSRDPLPSWTSTPVKERILNFVRAATTEGDPGFVPPPQRIAAFDNDGTLWCEQPMPVQAFFALDRARVLARTRPELGSRPAFRTLLEGDREALASLGKREIVEILLQTHSGMDRDELIAVARGWLETARHPRFDRPFTSCAYRPMLELLAFLRYSGFLAFLVSAGGVDFMRAFAADLYGIPAHRVIGSSGKTRIDADARGTHVIKRPELSSFNDRETKVANLALHAGQRPVLAFGNSDGDLAMLRYTASGPGPRLALLLHHDDPEREYAYDSDFEISPLREGLAEAREHGWLLSMKDSFAQILA